MDLLLPVFQLTYFVLHFIYSLGQAVLDCFHELYFFLVQKFNKKKHFYPNSKQLQDDGMKLKKLPRHIGLLCTAKQTHNLKQICHIINWCEGFGIKCLSLYDVEGIFKLKLPSLLDNISFLCVDFSVRVIVDGQVYMTGYKNINNSNKNNHGGKYRTLGANGVVDHSNVFSYPSFNRTTLTLNVLSIEDCKEDIARIVRKLCKTPNLNIDINCISSNLVTSGQCDPDLVAVVGRPVCTLGFLPWQIRLTEFLNIPSISRVDYYEFRKLLQIYSKCEQRFGS